MIPALRDGGYDDCRNNCIGELVIKFLLERRPATTVAEILDVWKGAGSVGFGASWETSIGESWQDFSKALERSSSYTNDASSDGSPGQAKGDEYIPEFTPAKIGGLTAALVFVSFCCLAKLVLLVRNVVTAHRANAEPSSAV